MLNSIFGLFIVGAIGTGIIRAAKGKKFSLGSCIVGGIVFLFLAPVVSWAFGLALNLIFLAAFIIGFIALVKWLLK